MPSLGELRSCCVLEGGIRVFQQPHQLTSTSLPNRAKSDPPTRVKRWLSARRAHWYELAQLVISTQPFGDPQCSKSLVFDRGSRRSFPILHAHTFGKGFPIRCLPRTNYTPLLRSWNRASTPVEVRLKHLLTGSLISVFDFKPSADVIIPIELCHSFPSRTALGCQAVVEMQSPAERCVDFVASGNKRAATTAPADEPRPNV